MAQIVVLSTKTQKKYTLDVQGNKLSDLKAVLENNQIDYNGMTFFEGRTKTELLSNDSTFPDNAVIRLTKAEKKITSGTTFLTRDDCKAFIVKNPTVAATIKTKEGKNWTNCGTAVLMKYCTEATASKKPVATTTVKETKPVKVETPDDKEAWIEQGVQKGYIDASIATQLRNAVKVEAISKSDMDLFNF